MKVELDQNGCLKITAETPLESYALKKYCEDNFKDKVCNKNLVVDFSFKSYPPMPAAPRSF